MSDTDHGGIGALPHPQPRQMQPWHRLSAIKDYASQLQMLHLKEKVLFQDLFKVHPDHCASVENVMEQIQAAERKLQQHGLTVRNVETELWKLLGEPEMGFAMAVDLGDRTIVIGDEGHHLWVRDLIGLVDHIEQMEGAA